MRIFLDEVDKLEALFAESARLADSPANRLLSVKLRGQIFTLVADIGAAGEISIRDKKSSDAFREEYSRMRAAVAKHYGSWPISRIVLDDEEYQTSVRQMRLACNRFFGWVRAATLIDSAT